MANIWFTKLDVLAALAKLSLDLIEGQVVGETDLMINDNLMYYFLNPDGYIEVLLYDCDNDGRMLRESQFVMALLPAIIDSETGVATAAFA